MDTEASNTENATDLKAGPFSVLYRAVRENTQVLINVRNNHKLLGRVKAYDRHMNLCVTSCMLSSVCLSSYSIAYCCVWIVCVCV